MMLDENMPPWGERLRIDDIGVATLMRVGVVAMLLADGMTIEAETNMTMVVEDGEPHRFEPRFMRAYRDVRLTYVLELLRPHGEAIPLVSSQDPRLVAEAFCYRRRPVDKGGKSMRLMAMIEPNPPSGCPACTGLGRHLLSALVQRGTVRLERIDMPVPPRRDVFGCCNCGVFWRVCMMDDLPSGDIVAGMAADEEQEGE